MRLMIRKTLLIMVAISVVGAGCMPVAKEPPVAPTAVLPPPSRAQVAGPVDVWLNDVTVGELELFDEQIRSKWRSNDSVVFGGGVAVVESSPTPGKLQQSSGFSLGAGRILVIRYTADAVFEVAADSGEDFSFGLRHTGTRLAPMVWEQTQTNDTVILSGPLVPQPERRYAVLLAKSPVGASVMMVIWDLEDSAQRASYTTGFGLEWEGADWLPRVSVEAGTVVVEAVAEFGLSEIEDLPFLPSASAQYPANVRIEWGDEGDTIGINYSTTVGNDWISTRTLSFEASITHQPLSAAEPAPCIWTTDGTGEPRAIYPINVQLAESSPPVIVGSATFLSPELDEVVTASFAYICDDDATTLSIDFLLAID